MANLGTSRFTRPLCADLGLAHGGLILWPIRAAARGVTMRRAATPCRGVPCHRGTFRGAWDSYSILTSHAARSTFEKSQEEIV